MGTITKSETMLLISWQALRSCVHMWRAIAFDCRSHSATTAMLQWVQADHPVMSDGASAALSVTIPLYTPTAQQSEHS